MARINAAFETLIDPTRRSEYDAMLAGGTFVEQPREAAPQKPVVVRLLQRLKGHKTPVYAVSFVPDTGQLISSAFDNEVLWWDEAAGQPARRTKVESGVISTLRAFTKDRVVAAGSAESQVTVALLRGEKVDAFRTSAEEWVGCLAISSDGESLAAGSIHRALNVTHTGDGSSVYRRCDHDDAVTSVAWSEDNRLLATGSADATVRIWDARSGESLRTIRRVRGPITALAFSGDGYYLAAAGVDLSIRVFRLDDGELVKMMYGHTKVIESLAFHPNNWLFASASRDGSVGLWNAAKGVGNVRLDVSTRPVSCVAFSSDGTRLAAAGQDRLVRMWEVVAKDSAG